MLKSNSEFFQIFWKSKTVDGGSKNIIADGKLI